LQSLESAYVTQNNLKRLENQYRILRKVVERFGLGIFSDKTDYATTTELTLGGGKGSLDHYVFPLSQEEYFLN
jgi:hypothetical protein